MLESSKVCLTTDLPKELSHLSKRRLNENSPKFPTKFGGVLLLGFFKWNMICLLWALSVEQPLAALTVWGIDYRSLKDNFLSSGGFV